MVKSRSQLHFAESLSLEKGLSSGVAGAIFLLNSILHLSPYVRTYVLRA